MPYEQQELTLPESTSFSEARHVRLPALLENVWELLTNVTDGRNFSESLAWLDQDGCWRRMYQGYYRLMMDGYSEPYSKKWPKWGIASDGVAGALKISVRHTGESDCLFWATPSASDAVGSTGGRQRTSLRTDIAKHERLTGKKGQINPDWVEVLQGYPIGWTRLPLDWNLKDGQREKEAVNLIGSRHG